MRCLFIGGCIDGCYVEVPDVLPERYPAIILNPPQSEMYQKLEIELSGLELAALTERLYVYAAQDLSQVEVLRRLIEGYRPAEKAMFA